MSNFNEFSPITDGLTGAAPALYTASTDDALATIEAAGYLTDKSEFLKQDDVLFINYNVDATAGQMVGYVDIDGSDYNFVPGLPGIAGDLVYQGTWNASTNTPTLANPPAASTRGDYYVVSVAGTQFSLTFEVGDWIISNGSAWQKVANAAGTTLADGNIWVGNASNIATPVTVSGDITLSNAGVAAIGSGVIVDADVKADAAIALSKLKTVDASRALVSDGSGFVSASAVTSTELGYVGGVTSALQTQLDAKASNVLTDSHILVGSAINVATDVALSGVLAINSAGVTSIVPDSLVNADVNTNAAIALTKLASTTVSRALVSDVTGFVSAATTTAAEIEFVNGVTSAIQTQLDSKLASSSLLVPYSVTRPSAAGGAAAQTFTLTGSVDTDVVQVTVLSSANPVSVLKAVPSITNDVVVTFSVDPGAVQILLTAWHTV